MNDEFYVGYQPKAPPSLAKTVIRIAAGLVLAGLAVGALLVLDQPPFAASRFEFGVYREYTGTIEDWPYPALVTANSSYVLVAPGKHGLVGLEGYEQRSVRLKGSLIERGTDHMLEVVPGSLEEIASAPPAASRTVGFGAVTLRGEIVDSKCYFGVMNPGERKVHRDCAVRCISGGIPAAFIVRDASGVVRTLLLIGDNGAALNRELLPFVAEPIEISGELVKSGSTLVLKANPAHFRRLLGT